MRELEQAKEAIEEHPLLVVGGALLVGALFGFGKPKGRITGALASAFGAIAISLLRDAAVDRVSGLAKSWIDDTERKRADDVRAKNRAVDEAFLEH